MEKLKINQVKPIWYNEKSRELIFEYGCAKYSGLVKNGLIYAIEQIKDEKEQNANRY